MKISHLLVMIGLLAVLLGCARPRGATVAETESEATLQYNSYQGAGSN